MANSQKIDLFTPFDLGAVTLQNRIVMAPMTRTRASSDGVATSLMRDYYAQRASAGLIVTECTQVSEQARGIIRAPGIHRPDQIAAWRIVTDEVHMAGGRIYNQIWHCGRVAHPEMRGGAHPEMRGGAEAVAPSPRPAAGDFYLPRGRVEFPIPRELAMHELPGIVESFAAATRNARAAGFDGVEVHGANGYLLDQFLQSGSNSRTDRYGGSPENRARLLLETLEATIGAWSADHVGLRLSPSSFLYGMDDANKLETFGHTVRAVDRLGLAYLHLTEPSANALKRGVQIERVAATFRPMTRLPLIISTGFDKQRANAVLAAGEADLVGFGVPFIANPDLVERFRRDAPLNVPNPATFYIDGPEGYNDYPQLRD